MKTDCLYISEKYIISNSNLTLVKNFDEAIHFINEKSIIPKTIYIASDLITKDNLNAYFFIKYLIKLDKNKKVAFPESFIFYIDSSKKSEKERLYGYINRYLETKYKQLNKSSKIVLFRMEDFTYNLFWSSYLPQGTNILMDEIISRYLMQSSKKNTEKLVELYGKENVVRVLNNIKIQDGIRTYDTIFERLCIFDFINM